MSIPISHLLVIFLLNFITVENGADATVCCAPDQWEGRMYLDYMQVFIDANTLYLYFNGSVSVSYDYTNGRVYYSVSGTELSPLIPKPQPINKTQIIDFKKNIMYDISGSTCQKSKVDQNMTKECVQDGDILQSSGKVGNGIMTDTYIMTMSEIFNNVRGTVERGTCLPVHMVYIMGIDNPDSGTVTSLDVLSVVPGIKNPKIFDPPQPCHQSPQQPPNSFSTRECCMAKPCFCC